ncbi:MAG: DUF6029 family protein [Bacteroidota bacterium]|nr:DUF6029 family protein [Bacteroidota bacterium]MDX5431936.1 DUF6029 family protein [Bacteroidota bacterium]MDX5470654.1 DUF6029 family protein [Bacteroidota bacterium]
MKRNFTLLGLLFTLMFSRSYAQENKYGELSGNFQTNAQFYVRDDRIGANTIQYQRQKSSTDAWLFLNYKFQGFDITARYDIFNNSPLLNPQQAYTNGGIGYWSVKKSIGKLTLTGGYFYDQFGSGASFRAFEDRLIGLDYAIRGIKIDYQISDSWYIKAFTGQQKGFLDLNTNEDSRFTVSPQVIQGIYSDKRFKIGDDLSIDLGIGGVNRILDGETLNRLTSEINGLPLAERFQPRSNTYIATGMLTLNYKGFSLSGEYNYKTKEALRNPFTQQLFGSDGSVLFSSLGYSRKGLGVNVSYKRVETYQFRSSPYDVLLNGQVTYLPSITRQNVYRLLARYIPVVQELGENAFAADILWTPFKKLTINANVSRVDRLNGTKLFEEIYIDALYKFSKKLKVQLGFQRIFYSQSVYQLSPAAPDVYAYTPFTEITYKLTTKQSLRFEAQYLHTEQDLGSFVNALIEYNFAPHWSFSIGDMVNTSPVRTPGTPQEAISDEIIHYYNIFASYQMGATRFTLNYLKQVQGVNCTGGICRVEPAFSGLRFGLITNF